MTRKDGESVQHLAARIFELLRKHPHEPFTRKQLAEALETSPKNTIFGMSVAYARRLAASSGDCITSCVWDSAVRAHAMRFLPRGQERESALGPLFQRSATTQEHMSALQLEARYSAHSAETPAAREHAQFTERAMEAANDQLSQANQMMLKFMEASEEVERLQSRVEELENASQPAPLF